MHHAVDPQWGAIARSSFPIATMLLSSPESSGLPDRRIMSFFLIAVISSEETATRHAGVLRERGDSVAGSGACQSPLVVLREPFGGCRVAARRCRRARDNAAPRAAHDPPGSRRVPSSALSGTTDPCSNSGRVWYERVCHLGCRLLEHNGGRAAPSASTS